MDDANNTVFLIIAASVVFAAALVGILVFIVKRLAGKAYKKVQEDWGEEGIVLADKYANFFGIESLGAFQVRGNGVLILTEKGLRFRMLLPQKVISIDLAAIQKLDTPKWHIGKSTGRPLLKVTFTAESGESDSAAWLVSRLDTWLEQLRARTGLQ